MLKKLDLRKYNWANLTLFILALAYNKEEILGVIEP